MHRRSIGHGGVCISGVHYTSGVSIMNNSKENEFLVLINKLNLLAIREHYQCEDEYYSCPYYTTGSCNCGTIEHNQNAGKIRDEIDRVMEWTR